MGLASMKKSWSIGYDEDVLENGYPWALLLGVHYSKPIWRESWLHLVKLLMTQKNFCMHIQEDMCKNVENRFV